MGHGQLIMLCQARIEQSPVRVHQFSDGMVAAKHFGKIGLGLMDHTLFQPRPVTGIELWIGFKHAHTMQLKPL